MKDFSSGTFSTINLFDLFIFIPGIIDFYNGTFPTYILFNNLLSTTGTITLVN